MTTNPQGRMFFSYARKSAAEAQPLLEALQNVGIPYWLDTSDLGPTAANPELERVLADPNTAGAILFLTDDVRPSKTIQDIEVPAIQRRLELSRRKGDAFFVVAVAADGLERANAASVLGSNSLFGEAFTHNTYHLPRNATVGQAAEVARNILQQRLQRIDAVLGASPIVVQLSTFEPPGFNPAIGLSMDFSRLFSNRIAPPEAWSRHITPSLDRVYHAIRQAMPTRSVQLTGKCTLTTALATGIAFRHPRGITASWLQQGRIGTMEWGASLPPGEAVWTKDVQGASTADSGDMLVTVGITNDVIPAAATSPSLPQAYRSRIHFIAETTPLQLSGSQAAQLADDLASTVRSAISQTPRVVRIHLVMAGPTGLSFLIGQGLNALPPVCVYEFLPPSYVLGATLTPTITAHGMG